MGLSRRHLLLGGLATGGIGVAATGFGLTLGPPAAGSLALTAQELAVVEAVALVFFPGAQLPIDGARARVAESVDRIVADVLDETAATAFRYVLRTLEWGTLASRGRAFTALSPTEQRDVLDTWTAPDVVPRRIALESLKAVLGMAYFAHPDVISAIGWRTGCGGTTS